jgi:hypothetical protein
VRADIPAGDVEATGQTAEAELVADAVRRRGEEELVVECIETGKAAELAERGGGPR